MNEANVHEQVDVVVVGAGLAGLLAARELQAENADTWDAQTLESWLLANAKTEVGLGYWRTMVPALFSAEAAEMSLLHFLFYCRSGGTLDRLVATPGGAPES